MNFEFKYYCRQQVYKDLIAINCASVSMMSSLVLPQMVTKNKGVIVNISSIAKRPSLMTTVYSATKSYISTLTEGLQRGYCTKDSGETINKVYLILWEGINAYCILPACLKSWLMFILGSLFLIDDFLRLL